MRWIFVLEESPCNSAWGLQLAPQDLDVHGQKAGPRDGCWFDLVGTTDKSWGAYFLNFEAGWVRSEVDGWQSGEKKGVFYEWNVEQNPV